MSPPLSWNQLKAFFYFSQLLQIYHNTDGFNLFEIQHKLQSKITLLFFLQTVFLPFCSTQPNSDQTYFKQLMSYSQIMCLSVSLPSCFLSPTFSQTQSAPKHNSNSVLSQTSTESPPQSPQTRCKHTEVLQTVNHQSGPAGLITTAVFIISGRNLFFPVHMSSHVAAEKVARIRGWNLV